MMTACFSVEILIFLTKLHLGEMEVISTQKFILLTLATVAFLTPHGMCLDELMKSSLESREEDDDKYYEVRFVLLR